MFDHHRKSPWFAEKYDPSAQYAYLRKRVRKEGWRGRLNIFLENLDAGMFDLQPGDLYQPASAKQSMTIKKEEPKDDQEVLADHDGLAPVDESMKVDDDVVVEVEDDGDKLDANGKGTENGRKDSRDRGEEVSVAPEGHQVMIRTIPPDIGRVKLETVGVRIPCRGF
jgi:SERRATE/Ars2, N-terminal domain